MHKTHRVGCKKKKQTFSFFFFSYIFLFPDSGHVPSSPLGSPTSHRGMHPPLLSPTSMGPSGSLHSPISTLSSPMNGLASPFSVISSPMGPHSMNSPGMGYGSSVSPQVRSAMDWVQKCYYLFTFTYAKRNLSTVQFKRCVWVFFSLIISFVRYINFLVGSLKHLSAQ